MWGLAIFGIGPTPLGAATLISSLYDSTRALRLPTLPHEWSVKVWQGTGLVQVGKENHRLVLRLETEEGCINLFRSLNVKLQGNPLVSWEWNVLPLPTGEASQNVGRDDHEAAFYLVFSSRGKAGQKTAIGYVWDNALPVGEILTRPDEPSVHYVVVRSGGSIKQVVEGRATCTFRLSQNLWGRTLKIEGNVLGRGFGRDQVKSNQSVWTYLVSLRVSVNQRGSDPGVRRFSGIPTE